MKILTESWELSENTAPVQDEINSAVAQVLTSYTYDNPFQSNITDSHHSVHTPHSFPDNFEIPMLNHTYSNTSAHPSQDTDLVNLTPCKITSPSSNFHKAKHYRIRTIPPKLAALSKLRNKSQTPSIKTVTPVVLNHTVSHNNKSSSENTLNTQLNSDANTFSTVKTVCHCDDPNFKLFREIQLDSHPIVIKKNDQLVFFITPDLQICRFK